MKKEIKLLLVVLLVGIATSSLKHEKKVRSHKKSKHSSSSGDEINYDDFINSSHQRRLAHKRQDQAAVVFNETFLNEFKRVEKQQFLWRRLENKEEVEVLGLKELQLNQYGLYVHQVGDDSITGLVDMIRLDEMVTEAEVQQLREKKPMLEDVIEELEMVQIKSNEFSGEFPCFAINDLKQPGSQWQVCQNGYTMKMFDSQLYKFRNTLIQKVIMNVEIKNNLKYTVNIQTSQIGQKDDNFDGWSYEKQGLWKGLCASSAEQSPIDIITDEIVATTNQIQVLTGYKGDENTMAIRGTNDYFLVGKFGYVLYQNALESKQNYYCAWRIEFKFNSEHQINSADKDMEVLVYHKENRAKPYQTGQNPKTQNACDGEVAELVDQFTTLENETEERDLTSENTQLIVSFLVSSSATVNQEDTGVFWQGLNVVNFAGILGKKYEATKIMGDGNGVENGKTLASLEGLVDDGLNPRFQHSFYYYTGSLSQPGCSDDVKRVVMYEDILITPLMFNTLKEKVLDGFNYKENNRLPINQGKGTMKAGAIPYKVFKHIDTTQKAKCPTKEILQKYTNKDYKKRLTPGEYQNYLDLISKASADEAMYSNAYKNFQSQIEAQKQDNNNGGIKNVQTQFNKEVTLKTQLHHVHKVPKALVGKLFGDNPQQGKVIRMGNTENDLAITYLGKNTQDYTDNMYITKDLDSGQINLKNQANQVIDINDKEMVKKDQLDKVINQDTLKSVQESKQSTNEQESGNTQTETKTTSSKQQIGNTKITTTSTYSSTKSATKYNNRFQKQSNRKKKRRM